MTSLPHFAPHLSPTTYEPPPHRPAYLKGFLWFIFSGAASLSAFVLPVHLWALIQGYEPKNLFFGMLPIGALYFIVVLEAALYHGLYRTKTILFDLGCIRYSRLIDIIAALLFAVFSLLLVAAVLLSSLSAR